MSSPMLDAEPELSAKDILARLERYAAAYRSTHPGASARAPRPRESAATGAPSITSVRIIESPASAPVLAPPTDDFQPHDLPRHRIDPATADLFPYDLAATIVGCIATIVANMILAGPLAVAVTVGLAVAAEASRRRRWFPSVGVNLMIGLVAGALLVLTA